MDDVLIAIRTLHFAATVSACGTVFFRAFVAEPTFRTAAADEGDRTHGTAAAMALRFWLALINWLSLGLAAASNVAWFAVEAAQMNDLPMTALSGNAAWGILSDTQFGAVWSFRSAAIVLFAMALLWLPQGRAGIAIHNALLIAIAATLSGSLAFAGHAAAGEGVAGAIHLASDVLHMEAATAWLGALVPLALLLGPANRKGCLAAARAAILGFSTLGVISVAMLLFTGIVNSWMLVGTPSALFATDYGRLLSLKIVLFLAMLAVATINRTQLTPRLVHVADEAAARRAAHQLRINCLIEAALGTIIIVIVGALGTLPPGAHEGDASASGPTAVAVSPRR